MPPQPRPSDTPDHHSFCYDTWALHRQDDRLPWSSVLSKDLHPHMRTVVLLAYLQRPRVPQAADYPQCTNGKHNPSLKRTYIAQQDLPHVSTYWNNSRKLCNFFFMMYLHNPKTIGLLNTSKASLFILVRVIQTVVLTYTHTMALIGHTCIPV